MAMEEWLRQSVLHRCPKKSNCSHSNQKSLHTLLKLRKEMTVITPDDIMIHKQVRE